MCLKPYASSIQCACVILSSVACLPLQYFSTLSHKEYNFWKVSVRITVPSDFIYKFCLQHFSFKEEMSKIWSKMYISLHVPTILVKFSWKMKFLYRFLKNTPISISMKIHTLEAKLFHADGQTDRQDEAELFALSWMHLKNCQCTLPLNQTNVLIPQQNT